MQNKKITNWLIMFIIVSVMTLTLPTALADDNFVDVVTVTVPVSCSIATSGMSSHVASIQNGVTTEDIGSTTIKVTCNDNTGYALYAIGYTNDEYGNNKLTNATLGSTHDIITSSTVTSGTSSWAMKLTKAGSTYLPIIAGSTDDTNKQTGDPDFSGYTAVPEEYTKVAYFPSSTDIGSGASGSNLTTTYRAYISQTQPAGTYVGQVKYILVHPNNTEAPVAPVNIESALRKSGKQKMGNYYKMQDMSSNICSMVNLEGDDSKATLVDARDGKTYRVSKLADGKCWMLDNLALDITNVDIDTLKGNTNASDTTLEYLKGVRSRNVALDPSGNYSTSVVIKEWTDNNGGSYSSPMIAVDSSTSGSCYNSYCVNGGVAGSPWAYNDITPEIINGRTSIVQGQIGVYYNYCAASAGSYCYGDNADNTGSPSSDPDTSTLRDATEDICPASWRLPTGGDEGEYTNLYSQYSSSSNQTAAFQTALSTPLSGFFYSGKAYDQGYYGYTWSSTWYDAENIMSLNINVDNVSPTNHSNRYDGRSVRCVVGSQTLVYFYTL